MTYLVHEGKVMNEKKTIEEKQHWSRDCWEEWTKARCKTHRKQKKEKTRKLEETSKGKSTRTSEESIFLQREIIHAIRKSEEKIEIYSRKTDKKMDKFLQTITGSVGTQLHGMNSTIVKMQEEDDRHKQISEIIMNMEKKILDIDENVKTEVTNPGEHMKTRIKVRL